MFRGIYAPVMRPLLDQDEDWPIAATLPTHFLAHQSVSRAAPYRTKACTGRRSMQGLRDRTKKEDAPSSHGGVCLSKLDRITDLELKGLTGIDTRYGLLCARVLQRYPTTYIPRVGISGFPRLRPYRELPKLPAILLKNCAHPPAKDLVAPGNSVPLHIHLQTSTSVQRP